MRGLPKFVQRAPAFFYGAAVLYFVGQVVLTHFQLENARGTAGGPIDSYSKLATLSAWLQAFEGAIYLTANGVIAQILLAIWRGNHGPDLGGDE